MGEVVTYGIFLDPETQYKVVNQDAVLRHRNDLLRLPTIRADTVTPDVYLSCLAPDDDGRTLNPLNMEEPFLIAQHSDRAETLGFALHGIGSNLNCPSGSLKRVRGGCRRGYDNRPCAPARAGSSA